MIPLVVTLLAGGYYALQPDRYRLTGHFTVNYGQQELQQADVNFPPPEILSQRFRSAELLASVYPDVFPSVPNNQVRSAAAGFAAGTTLSWDTGASPVSFRITKVTSNPDSTALLTEQWMETFEQQEFKKLQDQLKKQRREITQRLTQLRDEWSSWNQSWGAMVTKNNPEFLQPRLSQAKSDYQEAVKKLESVKRNYAIVDAKLRTVKELLAEEPKILGYKNSISLPFLMQNGSGKSVSVDQLKEFPSDVINKSYLELRQSRMKQQIENRELRTRKDVLEKQLQEAKKEVETLETRIPSLEHRKQLLTSRQKYLTNKITQLESDRQQVAFLLNAPVDLIETYPATSPGEPLSSHGRRNTALAGAVSFLLLFFGTAFWEIL